MPLVPRDRGDANIDVAPTAEQVSLGVGKLELHPHAEAREVACLDFVGPAQNAVQHVQPLHQQHRKHYPKDVHARGMQRHCNPEDKMEVVQAIAGLKRQTTLESGS